jgi:dTDP-4-dehydrorhamnose reductase
MRVLLTGAHGLLGTAVAEAFSRAHEVHRAPRAALDITDADAVARAVSLFKPDVIVNCAAYNDVDGAEKDAITAFSVNALGVLALARAARASDITLVHYSSDFVFDGETTQPYGEQDDPNPRSVYAASKLLGEWFAAEVPRYYVLRVESLFGAAGSSASARRGSLGTIVDRIRCGDVVPVFVDRTVSPSFTFDVAAATRRLVESKAPPGTYHCVNDGAVSWQEIAQEAARLLGLELRMQPITLAKASLKATRPRFCALSPARLASLGIVMPPWQDALARYLRLPATSGSGLKIGC